MMIVQIHVHNLYEIEVVADDEEEAIDGAGEMTIGEIERDGRLVKAFTDGAKLIDNN